MIKLLWLAVSEMIIIFSKPRRCLVKQNIYSRKQQVFKKNINRLCLVMCILFFGAYQMQAQLYDQEADSLKIELIKPENNKIKSILLYKILTNTYQTDTIKRYINMGLAYSKKNNDNEWYAKFMLLKGRSLFDIKKDSFYTYKNLALSKAKESETKEFIYEQLMLEYVYSHKDSTMFYLNKLKSLNTKNLKIAGNVCYVRGYLLYKYEKKYTEAIALFKQAIDLQIESGFTKNIYLFYHKMSFSHRYAGNYEMSINALKKALSYTKPNTYEYGRTLVLLSSFNQDKLGKDSLNIRYKERAIEAYINSNTENNLIASGYKNLSKSYLNFNMNKKAIKAINNLKKYGDKTITPNVFKFYYHQLLGNYYNNLNMLNSAEFHLDKGNELAKKNEINVSLNYNIYELGLIHIKRKQYQNAKRFFLQTINATDFELASYEQLYRISKLQNNYPKALDWLEKMIHLKDSIANERKTNVLEEFNVKFKTKEKENELLVANLENNKKDAKLVAQKRTSTLIIGFIAFLVILLIILFFTFKSKKELKLKLELEKEKEFILEKNNILGNLSHEIRTPITIINGYLHLIIQQKIKPLAVERFANIAVKSNNNLLTKFNDFSSTISASQNNLNVQKETKIIVPFIDEIMHSYKGHASLKNIGIFYKNNLKENTSLYFDFGKLHKIITNLISNALKYSNPNKNIFIDVLLQEKSFVIIVKDEGFGIPKKEHTLIFDRFYQSKKHKISGGVGIGLSYVKELVQLLKGTITLESKEEIGSIFTVTFPVETKHYSLLTNTLQPTYKVFNEVKEQHTGIENNLPKVLIVEDHLDLIIYLKEILIQHYQCVFVHNGEEALKAVKKNNFDLIISDYKMPIMSGLMLKSELNKLQKYKDVPFLLLTAFSFDNYEDIQLRLGIEDYVAKPFTYEELITRTRKLLENTLYIKNIKDIDNTLQLDGHVAELIEKTKMCIINNLSNSEYTVADLARDCNYSQKQLGKIIKAYTGLTVVQLVLEVKLQKAYELILNNKHPTLIEIVFAVGLSNRSYFNKKFKARFGLKPSDLQNRLVL